MLNREVDAFISNNDETYKKWEKLFLTSYYIIISYLYNINMLAIISSSIDIKNQKDLQKLNDIYEENINNIFKYILNNKYFIF